MKRLQESRQDRIPSQAGINMVDLMMWLVIAAMLLAAAIQGIGYYQKAAYLYQTNAVVEVTAGKVSAAAAIDGTVVTQEIIDRIVAEENAATPNDQITLTAGKIASYASGSAGAEDYGFERASVSAATTGGQSQYIKAVHDAVADRESVYFFQATASYKAGVNVVDEGAIVAPATPEEAPSTPAEPEVIVPAKYNWASSEGAGTTNWRSVATSANGQFLMAGRYNGGLFVSKDGGANWSQQNIVHERTGIWLWRAVAISDDGQVMAANSGDGYYIYTSRDGGATWKENSAIAGGVWWAISMTPDGKKMIASDYGQTLNSPLTGAPTIGRVIISNDSGLTWTEVGGLPKGKWRSAAISPDGSTLAVGGMAELGVQISTDGGTTWTKTYANDLEVTTGIDMSSNGREIIVTLQGSTTATSATGGKVKYSSDFGATWVDVTPSPQNWISSAISPDGKSIIIAAHNEYLYISNDHAKTFTPQIEGLGVGQWGKVDISADSSQIITSRNGTTGTVLLGKIVVD